MSEPAVLHLPEKDQMRIVVDPLADDRWASLIEQRPSDVFHSPHWLRVLARTYGFQPQAVLLLDADGKPVAGLSYCLIDGLPAKRIATPPFSDFCDPIVNDESEWEALAQPLLNEGCSVTVRCLHNDVPVGASNVQVVNRAKWHGFDLTRDPDTIWNELEASARRAIRKARASQVTIRAAKDPAELRAFFELHLKIRKYKYRLLAQPFAFFENIWEELVAPGMGSLMCAFHEDRIVAGVMFLEWKGTMYYKFNACEAEYLSVRPNDLIIWESICLAHDRGLRKFDFGLSDWDQDGLIRYKRKYATEEKTISFLRVGDSPAPSSTTTDVRALLRTVTDLLTADGVPDEITERGGNSFYRYFA